MFHSYSFVPCCLLFLFDTESLSANPFLFTQSHDQTLGEPLDITPRRCEPISHVQIKLGMQRHKQVPDQSSMTRIMYFRNDVRWN